jgi:hypothetical protein
MEKFGLKKLNKIEGKEKYCIEALNRYAGLEDLSAGVDINSAWEAILENVEMSAIEALGYCERKKHKQAHTNDL